MDTLRVASPFKGGVEHSIRESMFLMVAGTILLSVADVNLHVIPPKLVDKLVPVMRTRVDPASAPALGQNSVIVGLG